MFSEAHNEWRKHPWLQRQNNLKKMFPGLGTAVVIFGTYLFVESFYNRLNERSAKHAPAAAVTASSVDK